MRQLFLLLWVSLLLGSCSYHLVGQSTGHGVIPSSATQVVILGEKDKLYQALRQRLLQSDDMPFVEQELGADDAVEIRVEQASELMTAVSFDSSGIANQYRITLSAVVRVVQSGQELWASESLAVAGDVFASGDVIAIEAQKEKVLQDLRRQWVQKLMGRLRSGF
ncbi:MAG: LPS assembly lipoprotein LptE [Mariprofundaceae bacterium]